MPLLSGFLQDTFPSLPGSRLLFEIVAALAADEALVQMLMK